MYVYASERYLNSYHELHVLSLFGLYVDCTVVHCTVSSYVEYDIWVEVSIHLSGLGIALTAWLSLDPIILPHPHAFRGQIISP